MDIRSPVLAILVGGAPAPGINGVISSVTIEALNSGCNVLGIYEGFKQLKQGKSMVTNLDYEDVTRIYNTGGSILRTSKQQLTSAGEIDNCLRVLEHHRVRYLVTIGGTQTAYSASLIAEAAKTMNVALSVVHVPKTIFNDLPLPPDAATFGYSTAREVGTQLLCNFASDARTMLRWYILVVMGQSAGHLSLGIGKAGAATVTLIPEQYAGKTLTFNTMVAILEAAIYKRKAMSKEYGTVIISEGLVHCLDKKEMTERFGDIHTAHQELGAHLTSELLKRFAAANVDVTVVTRNLGNELRAAAPNASDIELTRELGFGATRYLLEGGSNAIVTLKGGSLFPIPLIDLLDAKNRTTQIRMVDCTKLSFQVALSYMITLKQSDLQDMNFLSKLAKAANISAVEFVKKFQHIALPPSLFLASGHHHTNASQSSNHNYPDHLIVPDLAGRAQSAPIADKALEG